MVSNLGFNSNLLKIEHNIHRQIWQPLFSFWANRKEKDINLWNILKNHCVSNLDIHQIEGENIQNLVISFLSDIILNDLYT